MTPSTLHQIVAIGASLTAWVVRDPETMDVEVLFSFMDTLRTALIQFVHYVPFMSKAPAMWSLSVLRVSFVGALPRSHIGHTKSRNRSKNLGISPHMYTSQLFPITMRGIRQDAVSPTRPETAVVFRVRSCLCWFYCHISRKTWI